MKKMYIAVLDQFPDYMTPTLVAHAVLGYHLEMQLHDQDLWLSNYNDWLKFSFKKVVVRVNQKEFDKINMDVPATCCFHENNTLEGRDSCIVAVVDSEDIPNVLKYAKLWKPNIALTE